MSSPTYDEAHLAQMQAHYARDGFIRIDTLTSAADVAAITALLDPLFDAVTHVATPGHPEINEAVKLAPALLETQTYARCRAIARQLLGVPVGYIFDHAIYKRPRHDIVTAWHQDEIYNHAPMPQRAVNFWIPLQACNVDNGCLWHAPGSHLAGLRPHRAVGTGATQAMDSIDQAHAIPADVALGGGTAHHPLAAHYAGPNQTDQWRKAWVLHFGAYGKYRYKLHPRAILAKLGLAAKHRRGEG